MAAFLFFLSVALVVTNREDIRYTLFVDHKMRSNLAADAALDSALQTMRSVPDWESSLSNMPLSFASGAAYKVTWLPWNQPATGDGRHSIPQQVGRSTGIELIATGISGAFRSERHLLLEEFRLADSALVGGRKPHLFAVMGNNLQVLSPAFVWEAVATLHPQFLLRTVSAGGESLHYLAQEQGATPPEIQDFAMITTPEGVRIPGDMANSAMQIPRGHGGNILVLRDNKWDWELLPDPGEQLGGIRAQPTIAQDPSGTAEAKMGGKGWDDLTLDWDTIALSPSALTVDYSYFNGPRIEWYALTGQAAEFSNGKYYCHGTHYFYSGFRFKNSESPGGMVRSQGKDASLFQEPCILEYTASSKTWKPILDFLQVTDPLLEPTILPGLRPGQDSLVVDSSGTVYVKAQDATDHQWYRVTAERLQLAGLPTQPQLHFYNTQPLFFQPRTGSQVPTGTLALNQHDIAAYFPTFFPPRNIAPATVSGASIVPRIEPRLDLTWTYRPNSLTSFQKDLFCLATLMVRYEKPDSSEKVEEQATCLAHFDGENWQILPAGLGLLLPPGSALRSELKLGYSGGPGPATAAERLVLGGYASDKPLLRRYVPVARWGPG